MMLHIDFSADALIFDNFIEESRIIVDLAETFVKQTAALSRTPNVSNTVSLTKLKHPDSPPGADAHPTPGFYASEVLAWLLCIA